MEIEEKRMAGGNAILDEIVYNPDKGALHYKEVRYLLIRPETLAGMQKALERVSGTEANEIIFQGGFDGGYLSARKYREIYGFCDEEILDFMVRMGSQIGWGVSILPFLIRLQRAFVLRSGIHLLLKRTARLQKGFAT